MGRKPNFAYPSGRQPDALPPIDEIITKRFYTEPDVMHAELSLYEFTRQAWHVLHPATPFVEGWAVGCVAEHLQAVTEGDIDKLLVNIPPGCTKSMLANVMWPTWEWGPFGLASMQYINASYDKRLAVRDMMHTRDLISSEWFQERWPLEFKDDDRGKEKFANTSRGFRYATSVGGGLTGWRGQRFIIDDPHSVQLAESEAERGSAKFWFTETTPTRFTDPKKPVYVIIMQRLHVEDISGVVIESLMEKQGWTHLVLPMEAEKKYFCYTSVKPRHMGKDVKPKRVKRVKEEGDPLPFYVKAKASDPGAKLMYLQDPRTEEGELLWPERYDREAVRVLKAQLMVAGGEYAVAGQLQQRPIPRSGGMFKTDKIRYADDLPQGVDGRRVRGWDLAATDDDRAAWTVGALLMLDWDGGLWIEDVVRIRGEAEEVEALIKATAERDGYDTIISIPQDPGQAGKTQTKGFARDLHGYDVRFSLESGDKEVRAIPFAAQVNVGNVRMLRAEWNGPLMAELGLFPGSTFKDQVDALSRAYGEHLKEVDDPVAVFGAKLITPDD